MIYYGITHGVPKSALWHWKEFECSRGRHAFDEVLSTLGNGVHDHYLVCDACNLIVGIAYIDDTYIPVATAAVQGDYS